MMRRLAKVDEVNSAAVSMLSEASSFMTGSSIVVDGCAYCLVGGLCHRVYCWYDTHGWEVGV